MVQFKKRKNSQETENEDFNIFFRNVEGLSF